jgi:hypothetical protein
LTKGGVRSLFIFRGKPSPEYYHDLAESRGVTDEQEPLRRFLAAQKFYGVYHENMYLFDHVILNIGTPDERDKQVHQVVEGLGSGPRHTLCKPGNDERIPPRLLIVIARPATEEERLRRAVQSLQNTLALYILWKRRGSSHDEAILPQEPAHGTSEIIFEDPESTYGIRPSEIWEGLQGGVFQVVSASNIDTVNHFRRIFGELMVLLYIHSEPGIEDQVIIGDRHAAFGTYLENFVSFDHVLIDSGNEGDIPTQLFHLLLAYSTGNVGSTISSDLEEKLKARSRQPQIIGNEEPASGV